VLFRKTESLEVFFFFLKERPLLLSTHLLKILLRGFFLFLNVSKVSSSLGSRIKKEMFLGKLFACVWWLTGLFRKKGPWELFFRGDISFEKKIKNTNFIRRGQAVIGPFLLSPPIRIDTLPFLCLFSMNIQIR
jgi:hypothetical protein